MKYILEGIAVFVEIFRNLKKVMIFTRNVYDKLQDDLRSIKTENNINIDTPTFIEDVPKQFSSTKHDRSVM